MKRIPTCFICIFILFTFFQINAAAISHAHADTNDQKAILADINAFRSEHGLGPLHMNHFLSEIAKNHSRDMADRIVPFGHDGFKERMSRIFEEFRGARGFAENVALTDFDAKTVVGQWLRSSGHRKNIEGNYNLTGIGIAYDKNGRAYVTQLFLLNNAG